MTLRQDRLADEIRDIIGSAFQGGQMNDPRLTGVTITHVKLSADLQIARVYYRVYSDALDHQVIEKGLHAASGFLKKRLAKVLDVRRVPHLKFFYDDSVDHANRIEELLSKI